MENTIHSNCGLLSVWMRSHVVKKTKKQLLTNEALVHIAQSSKSLLSFFFKEKKLSISFVSSISLVHANTIRSFG